MIISATVKPGDKVHAHGITAVIKEVHYFDYYCGTWDIEFTDTDNIYRHWKQAEDGGLLIRAIDEKVNRILKDGYISCEKMHDDNGDFALVYRLPQNFMYKQGAFVVWYAADFSRIFFGDTIDNARDNAVAYLLRHGFKF